MKISVSTIWLSTLATPARSHSRPAPSLRLQPAEDGDVEEGRDAVGEDAAEPDARRSAHDRLERRQPRRVHVVGDAGTASTSRLSSSETISGTKPISTSRLAVVAAVQLGDRARRDDQQQEGENAGLDRERAERDLLVAEHAGDAHHAAVEDREGEQRQRDGGRRLRRVGSGLDFGRHGAKA